MSDVAIRVEGLGKQYRLGGRGAYQTLRERINGLCAAPLRPFHKRARGHVAQRFADCRRIRFHDAGFEQDDAVRLGLGRG